MSAWLTCAIGIVRAWTRLYTLHVDAADRDRRRGEIDSDLWEFHEDARRHGASPAAIAVCMIVRVLFGVADDVLWRIEYEQDAAMTPRRSTWMTAAAICATVCIGALWAFFAVTTLGALPPLPDPAHIERVYVRPLPPPPPPPPPRAWMVSDRSAPPPPPPRR